MDDKIIEEIDILFKEKEDVLFYSPFIGEKNIIQWCLSGQDAERSLNVTLKI